MLKSERSQNLTVPAVPLVRAYVALGLGLLMIGVSAILIRLADAPGPVSSFYRMFIGWLVLSVFFFGRRSHKNLSLKSLRWAGLAGVFFALDMTFWSTGIMLVGATKPTLLANTTPLWVGLGAMLLYKEKHPRIFWIGLAVALTGAVIVIGPESFIAGGLDLGSLFGLISAFLYSSYFLVAEHGRKETDSLAFVWGFTTVAALLLLVVVLLFQQPLTGYSQQTYLIFILMGVFIQAGAWLLLSYAQGHLPASIVSATLLGQPVLTAIFAVPLLGESFSLLEIIGGVAVITGVYIVNLSKHIKQTNKVNRE